MGKLLLFTPGPVNVAKNVRAAVAREDICHREIEFEVLLRSIEGRLLRLFEIRDHTSYQAVVISGSGTAANEAMLSSVVGEQNILILSNGEFGERLHALSVIHNNNSFVLGFPWGSSLDLNVIDAYLKEHSIDVIAMAHHETSSGMLNSLADIGALARKYGAMLLVDCVSSAGAESIDMERDNIAFCSSSCSKAIGSYPGLSFVIGKITEFEKLKALPEKSTYLNLYNFFQFATGRSQTPNTPAVPLFFAFNQALINILSESVPHRHAKIRGTATMLRRGMTKLGLRFLLEQKQMCSVLTTVHLPSDIDFESLQRELRKKSIIIYEGKGLFKGKMFQVGSIGELTHRDVQFFLRTLRDSLQNHMAAKLTRHPIIVNRIPQVSDIAITPSLVDGEVVVIDNDLNRPSLH